MKIDFQTTKMAKVLNSEKELQRTYGAPQAKKIKLRMKTLEAAATLHEVPKIPPDRCHQLAGDRDGQFAVDLVQPSRLIFKPKGDISRRPDGGIDLNKVTEITIIEIAKDYHD
jgi:proteic killer suppression protein